MKKQKLKQIIRKELHEAGWNSLPDGWDEDSLQSFARSLTGKTKSDSEGFFTACMDEVEDKFDEPEKFCASLKTQYIGKGWRGESTNESQNTNMKITESELRSIIREELGELETYAPPRETLGDQNVMRHELYDFIQSLENRGLDRQDLIKTAAATVREGIPKEYYREIINMLQKNTKR